MNELQIFKNDEFGQVRTLVANGKPYFVASDVARALGYVIPHKAIQTHCKGVLKWNIPTDGGNQEMLIIPEGDIYRLIVKSQLPFAEKFEAWVFDEVLPSIHKNGMYATDELLDNPDLLIKVATALKEERERNKALLAENSIMQPKADYFDSLVERNLLTNFRDTAKELGIKEKDFVTFLMNRRYIYRDRQRKLRPYADKNNGLFELKEFASQHSDHVGVQTLITPRGRETFRLLINVV